MDTKNQGFLSEYLKLVDSFSKFNNKKIENLLFQTKKKMRTIYLKQSGRMQQSTIASKTNDQVNLTRAVGADEFF